MQVAPAAGPAAEPKPEPKPEPEESSEMEEAKILLFTRDLKKAVNG
jgi:hypothetical protein